MTTQYDAWIEAEIRRVDDEALAVVGRPDVPLTGELFRRLRVAAWRRLRDPGINYISSVAGPAFIEHGPLPVTAQAGQWILPRPDSEVATRWHMLTGDLSWSPVYDRIGLLMACGYRDAMRSDSPIANQPPEGKACRHCLEPARAHQRMPEVGWRPR